MQSNRETLIAMMARVAAGDRVAFRAVYTATSAKLFGVALRILKRPELAEEVVQDAYVKIWDNAGRFDPTVASPITWMVAITRNRALDEVRKGATPVVNDLSLAMEVPDPQRLVSDLLVEAADHARLRACLDALDAERREIVQLAYLEGLSREALAARFGHPVATIKTWLHRSLKQLKGCLDA